MSNQLFRIVLLLTAAAMILSACAAPTPVATQVSPATQVAVPTQAPAATIAPISTATAIATATAAPTATAVLTTAPTAVPVKQHRRRSNVNSLATNDATQARLRVSQCVPNEPDMDVYINGKVPVTADVPMYVGAGDASRYEYLPPGTVSVAVVPQRDGQSTRPCSHRKTYRSKRAIATHWSYWGSPKSQPTNRS